MTINVEKFASYQDDKTPQTTHFEQDSDLFVMLHRGGHPDAQTQNTWDGMVLVRLEVDDEDYAVVEVDPSSAYRHDNLATIEAALAHLEAVRDRLRAFAAIEAAS